MNQHKRTVGLLALGRGVEGGWGCAGHPAHISLQKRLFVAMVAVVTIPLIGTSASATTISNLYGNDGSVNYVDVSSGIAAVGSVTVAQWFGDRFGSATEESVRASHPTFMPNEPPVNAQISSVGFRYRLYKSANHKTMTFTATAYASGLDLASTLLNPALGSYTWTQTTSSDANLWTDLWIPITDPANATWKDYNLIASDPSTQGYWWVVKCTSAPGGTGGTFDLKKLDPTGVWGNRAYQVTSPKNFEFRTRVEWTPEPATILLLGASLPLVLRRRSRQ